ncbi:MAG: hypothetical protein ACI9M1_002586 [Porticoccaceae bacterium]
MVISNFGEDKWEVIKVRSVIDIDFFISSEPDDGDITFKLAQAVSEEIGMTLRVVLVALENRGFLKRLRKNMVGLWKPVETI